MDTYTHIPQKQEIPFLCNTCHNIYSNAVASLSVAGDSLPDGSRARSSATSSSEDSPTGHGRYCSLCPLLKEGSNGGELFCLEVHGVASKVSLITQWTLDPQGKSAELLPLEGSRRPGSAFRWSRSLLPSRTEQCGTSCHCASFDGVNWELLKSWMDLCTDGHPSCGRTSTDTMGNDSLRVIDCGKRELVDIESQNQEYVTLSYVWGRRQTSPIQHPAKHDRLDKLPPLIEDALHATTALGLRYLWIDRYCIDQDNPEEKHRLIHNMGSIYANSCLTIITTCSDDPSQGIDGVSKPRQSRNLTINDHRVKISRFTASRDVASSRWNTRGWTYQESLLARRRLVLTKTQAYFQCYGMHRFETSGKMDPQASESLSRVTALSQPVFPEEGVGKTQHEICSRIFEYCRRDLSCEEDRVNAFQGILQLFSERFDIGSLSGLPIFPHPTFPHESTLSVNHLVTSLAWIFPHATSPVRNGHLPSWSWVGWKFRGRARSFGFPNFPKHLTSPVDHDKLWLSPCALVEIEFDNHVRISWNSSKEESLSYGGANNLPRFLLVRSWVAPVHQSGGSPPMEEDMHDPDYAQDHDVQGREENCLRLGRPDIGASVRFQTFEGVNTVSGFAQAVNNQDHSNPELLAVVMSADRALSAVVAFLVTPKRGSDHFEFCGVRHFSASGWRNSRRKERDDRDSDSSLTASTCLDSPFFKVDYEKQASGVMFGTGGIDFELRDIRIG